MVKSEYYSEALFLWTSLQLIGNFSTGGYSLSRNSDCGQYVYPKVGILIPTLVWDRF